MYDRGKPLNIVMEKVSAYDNRKVLTETGSQTTGLCLTYEHSTN